MKKKGTTESYSALIGIIIAFLMLSAIGCAVYNMYKPKGAEYFDKLTTLLKKMDEAGINELNEPGEMPFYVEKDKVLIGFGKKQEYVGKKGLGAIINWECYGITFGWGVFTPLGLTGSIDRPLDKCPEGKSCLCLCKMSFVDEVKQAACKESGVVCKTFDNLEFIGGEGCPQGVFFPGTSYTFKRGGYPTEVVILHYKKEGNLVSLDAKATKTKKELEELIEEYRKTIQINATVVMSSSCGDENNELAESLSLEFKHAEGMTPVRTTLKLEGACITPETFAKEIEKDYKNVNYFLQIEKDDSLTDYNTVVVKYIKDSSPSQNLAEEIINELRNGKFNVKKDVSEDPYLQLFAQLGRVVEIKTSKDNTLPAELIAKAVIKDKEKFAKQYPNVGEGWRWPVAGTPRVTSCYGTREGGQHAGLDIGPAVEGTMGDPVYAVGSGVVRRVVKTCPDTPQEGCGGNYGNHIVINQDNGFTVIYAHLTKKIDIEEGQRVSQSQQIGSIGNSGHSEAPHLHFGVYAEENLDANRVEGSINPVCLMDINNIAGKRCTTTPGTSTGRSCPLQA